MSLIMSVSGIRGVVGETMTPQVAADVGVAYADHLAGGRIVVGRDSRESGETLQAALVAGLVAGGCEVIDLGVVSTPGLGIMVGQRRAAGGVIGGLRLAFDHHHAHVGVPDGRRPTRRPCRRR